MPALPFPGVNNQAFGYQSTHPHQHQYQYQITNLLTQGANTNTASDLQLKPNEGMSIDLVGYKAKQIYMLMQIIVEQLLHRLPSKMSERTQMHSNALSPKLC